ncbi:unnamed protein product [Discosporangium mesarthrocarpum]
MSWDAGWPPLRKLSMHDVNRWCITKHSGISDKDLVRTRISEQRELHLPGYFVAVDHATHSVVLSVRGTFSMEDIITDLICDSTSFLGGEAHRGLSQSTEMLLADSKDEILHQLKLNEGYRLVICGHSLGAGVCIVLQGSGFWTLA